MGDAGIQVLESFTLASVLYEGRHTRLHRGRRLDGAPVVVKLLRSAYPSPRELAKLRHEYALLQQLAAVPGVVRALALERYGHGLALVLEAVPGQSLRALLEAGRLDSSTVLPIGMALAETLGALHQQRVLHKDIKPQNILVDLPTGRVTLLDFGTATRLAQETAEAVGLTRLEGTLAYMAPEQTGRMNRSVDARSDLYALGVTLYEMLTGVLPFVTTDLLELVHSHLARLPAPPRALVPEVPEVVSSLVMKLLAKAPEDRYQLAHGLKADLETCQRQLATTGRVETFPLGQRDRSGVLRLPEKLYGRRGAIAELLAAFERVSGGAAELLVVTGAAGVGKSALVHEVHKAIAQRQGGYFVSGKFDQLSRSVPYASIAAALRELVQQLLGESDAALGRWRSALVEALGPNGQLLLALIPELERIVGPQPSVPELGPAEAQNLFAMVFQKLFAVIATAEHPLVLFLDDLQWADLPSLKLVQILLTNPDRGHLLVLGAYRDNEVVVGHPLLDTLEALSKAGVTMAAMALASLDLPQVEELVADTVGQEGASTAALARLVWQKTQGNPFFVGQFLKMLADEGLLTFDAPACLFRWDLGRIEAARVTDNVVGLMTNRLGKLPAETQQLLELAACIGHQFDLGTLATVSERSSAEVAAGLWAALEEGLVVPLSTDYRLAHLPVLPALPLEPGAAEPPAELHVTYRFLHDRVQQAAYERVEPSRRPAVHRRLGRLLLQKGGGAPSPEVLFEVVNHLNLGRALVTEPAERRELMQLNLLAGQRAKASTAYPVAAAYFGAGVALVDEAVGEAQDARHLDLVLELLIEQAECEFLAGRVAHAEALFEALLPRVRSDLERARVATLRLVLYNTVGQYTKALAIAIETLERLGAAMPHGEPERGEAFRLELARIEENLAGRRIEDLLDAPALTDPVQYAISKLLTTSFSSIYAGDPGLSPLSTAKQTNIALRYGHSEFSAFGYVAYAVTLVCLKKYREACLFGRLGVALCTRFKDNPAARSTFAIFSHFQVPLREGLHGVVGALPDLLTTGQFEYGSYATYLIIFYRLGIGDELDAVLSSLEAFLVLMSRTHSALGAGTLKVQRQVVLNLLGRTKNRGTLSDDAVDERELIGQLERDQLLLSSCYYHASRLWLDFLYEEYEAALTSADPAEARSPYATSFYLVCELSFYTCLTLAALYPQKDMAERERFLARIDRHTADIAAWAESCPANYQHKHLLVRAERARILGQPYEAMDLYEEALTAAIATDCPNEIALANELAAKFYRGLGRTTIARAYMIEAHFHYVRWGAVAKAAQLTEAYPELFARKLDPAAGRETPVTVTSTSHGLSTGLFDATTLVRVAQALSSELDLDQLLGKLMRAALENAGAQRGVLVLAQPEGLRLEATLTIAPDELRLGVAQPLDASAPLASTVVAAVARTQEAVVLSHGAEDARFSSDPYLVAHRPKSVLSVALASQGRLVGVLYLENTATADAFPPARLELTALLASQAAIAIDNARLFARAEQATAKVCRANDQLESEVARRTEELRQANAHLELELGERERMEAERAALQAEIVRAQQARLVEMSTPLIPIADRVMVMPLIGTLDEERAQQLLETALNGVQANRAAVVIVDFTGVRAVTITVASSLAATTSALRLLGTAVVLTGIRPEVAQTLVRFDIALGAVVMRGTLQSGVAYALARFGGSREPNEVRAWRPG